MPPTTRLGPKTRPNSSILPIPFCKDTAQPSGFKIVAADLAPSTVPFVLKANSATIELNVWHALLATIKRIISLTPTVPSVLSADTSPKKSRVIVTIAKEGSIKMKKPSNFVFLVILGSMLLQSGVHTAMHAKRDDTSQKRGNLAA